ncbi:DUF1802 family protein [soil metagenome]
MTPPLTLPETCAWAFKEWAGICSALISGRQCLIFRKGGIEEGPSGFAPEHSAFWLLPTRLHEAQQGLRKVIPTPAPPPEGFLNLHALAVVDEVRRLDDPEAMPRLEAWHVWSEETLRQRFQYQRPGLWLLVVRVHRRAEPYRIEDDPSYAGCKSWVPLRTPLSTAGLAPVLDDDTFEIERVRLRSALDPSLAPKVAT